MKPDRYERDHALAAEYVLGTLRGAARRRFEIWMMESERLRRRVWYWERRLASLNRGLQGQAPPPAVWQRVERHLWQTRERPWRRWWWRAGGLCAAAVLILALLPFAQRFERPPAGPLYLGVVQNPQGQPLWLLESRPGSDVLHVRAVAPGEIATDSDYELWLLPRSGNPQSLGVLPGNGADRHIALSDDQQRTLQRSGRLAVSVEPRGGSPTGQPTGPVVYQARLLEIQPRLKG